MGVLCCAFFCINCHADPCRMVFEVCAALHPVSTTIICTNTAEQPRCSSCHPPSMVRHRAITASSWSRCVSARSNSAKRSIREVSWMSRFAFCSSALVPEFKSQYLSDASHGYIPVCHRYLQRFLIFEHTSGTVVYPASRLYPGWKRSSGIIRQPQLC